MTTLPNVNKLVSGATTEAEFQEAMGQMYEHLLESFNSGIIEDISISSGSITPSRGHILVDTEELESNDFLDNIIGTDIGDRLLFLQIKSEARTITIRHNRSGSGKILTLSGSDIVLTKLNQRVVLRYDTSTTSWSEMWNNFSLYLPTEDFKSAMRQNLGITDASLAPEFETGDIRPSFRSSPKTGWIFVQGQTLGKIGSGATLAGDLYKALYGFYWNNITNNTDVVVSGGRGANPDADWNANKTLTIPNTANRTPFGVGSSWRLGQVAGVSSVTIGRANLPAQSLTVSGVTNRTGGHAHGTKGNVAGVGLKGGTDWTLTQNGSTSGTTDISGDHEHTVSGTTEVLGEGLSMNITPRGFGVNWEQKL